MASSSLVWAARFIAVRMRAASAQDSPWLSATRRTRIWAKVSGLGWGGGAWGCGTSAATGIIGGATGCGWG